MTRRITSARSVSLNQKKSQNVCYDSRSPIPLSRFCPWDKTYKLTDAHGGGRTTSSNGVTNKGGGVGGNHRAEGPQTAINQKAEAIAVETTKVEAVAVAEDDVGNNVSVDGKQRRR